jgi:hypothetical protein
MEWMRFTDLVECTRCIQEIGDRLGLNGNVTAQYARPREDIDGFYVFPKPKETVVNRIEKLVRPVTIDSTDGFGNPVQLDSIEIVNKEYDEEGNDITVYDGTEYVLTQQTSISDTFMFEFVESVEWPIVIEEL